jgi:uncharacterized protein YdiU (UPF0061 family)
MLYMNRLQLAGLYKTALFHSNDKIVVDFNNIETVFSAKAVIETVCPFVGMLLGLDLALKTAYLLHPCSFGTRAEFFQDNMVWHSYPFVTICMKRSCIYYRLLLKEVYYMKLSDLTLEQNYLELDSEFYQRLAPTPLHKPKLIDLSEEACKLLDIDPASIDKAHLEKVINGEVLLEGSDPYAMCYAGHQFGFYSPRLGDGRAINLGHVKEYHLQLKGSGPTLYSRNADGRAVLRSSLREYLMSEAMFHLGVPTTRALGIISSEHDVQRETMEKGAIVLRMSPSWIRFGHFEYFFYKRKHDKLKALLDYAIKESYPHLHGKKDAYVLFFQELVKRTATLIAQWQAFGFNHGVMNTDNMSIAGLTIDYGPFSFLDQYDSNYICNHSDTEGRYSFGNQPYIAQWNLSKLMHALTPLIDEEPMQIALDSYRTIYTKVYTELMLKKLGLDKEIKEDRLLIRATLKLLQKNTTDYTAFFRRLSAYTSDISIFRNLNINKYELASWLDQYNKRLNIEALSREQRVTKMLQANPKYVLKNYMLQEAVDGIEKGDRTSFETLKQLLHNPFDEHPEFEAYARSTAQDHRNLQLSCSS